MERIETDVLIIGGGTGGAAAALQAAALGVRVVVAEPTIWLGGMITSAGVTCFDGNEGALGGGLFGELRAHLEAHYGGAEAVRTGWVSNTCFEPEVAARWFADKAAALPTLPVLHGADLVSVQRAADCVTGAVVLHGGREVAIHAAVTIDGTEYGDVIHQSGAGYDVGRESREQSGEPDAPEVADGEVQDMTYVVTIRELDPAAGPLPEPVAAPADYDAARYRCSTADDCDRPDPAVQGHGMHDWTSFINYGRLPNGRAMINWPFHANDFPGEVFGLTAAERAAHLDRAKQHTLGFLHYIQTTLGHPEWVLDADVYPTADGLPLMPYIRESRRLRGVVRVSEMDVVPAPGSVRPPFRRDGIAVGDYFIDHHHSKMFPTHPEHFAEHFPANAPFQIPLGALVPAEIDGLLAAEKAYSVTHIVNGCSRLQPVVMLVGQAAGALAACAVRSGSELRDVAPAEVQRILIDGGCQLVPLRDVPRHHPAFADVMRVLTAGGHLPDEPLFLNPDAPIPTDEAAARWSGLALDGDAPVAPTRADWFRAAAARLAESTAIAHRSPVQA